MKIYSALFLCLGLYSCNQGSKQVSDQQAAQSANKENIVWKDYGNEPTVLEIEDYTLANDNFRMALWTGDNLQVTLMSIPVGEDVGLELHTGIDQFLRIEEGKAKVMMGNNKDSLDYIQVAEEDCAILVPAGKWHNIINAGDKPLKLYSIYAPKEHSHGTVHQTRQEAMEAEHHHE